LAELGVELIPRDALVAIAGRTTTTTLPAQRFPRDLDATVVTSSPDVALAHVVAPAVRVDVLVTHAPPVYEALGVAIARPGAPVIPVAA
jgi:DeoR/GlpR family transcriptional regulator of sugar metabolism